MELIEKRVDDFVVLTMIGRMDAVTTPEFNNWFDTRIDAGDRRFIIDCGGLTYLSSAGLRGFLTVSKQTRAQEGRLLISGLFGVVREVFHVSGFLSMFEIYPSSEEAGAAMKNNPKSE